MRGLTTTVDLLFTGGSIFTGSGNPLTGYAVGVTGKRIEALIPETAAEALVDEKTRRIDLNGALLSPGFQDAHVHPVSAGVELLQCNLTEAESAQETVATIAEYAAANPDEPWILGAGWSMEHYPGGAPLRGLIDAVVPDRPVFLLNRDHHSAWANSEAIRIAGIDASTPDPVDGRIEREANGFPAGTFHEGASELFVGVRPETTPDLAYRGLLRAQKELIALGVTGWQDAWVGESGVGAGGRAAYMRAVDERTLKVHVVGAQWWERDQGLEQIDRILELREARLRSATRDKFELGTVKIMLDGVAENFTASMIQPYRDVAGHDTCNHGISFVDRDILFEAVKRLDAAGMQVHFHALGDRAVRDALDALAAARAANGPSDGRHHLAHLQVIAEVDTSRFVVVDATANIQALWAAHEDQLDTLTLPFLQQGAEARQYPFGDLEAAGTRLASGSDWPVSNADPLAAIHIAVTRVAPDSEAEPLGGAHQKLDLATAFAAYTSGSAYVNHRDHDTGHIREGYLANLIIVEPDPFTLSANDLPRAQITSTWIEGERVYVLPKTL